jgi:capsular exopolysaccharide synthesis family protein
MVEKKSASEDALDPREAIAVREDAGTPLSGRRLDVPTRALPPAVPPSAVRADSLLVVLWRSRWLMLIGILAAINGGIAYIQNVTPIYTSTAKLYLDYAGIRISNPYDPVGRPQTDKYLCTQAELIKSRPILTFAQDALMPQRLRTLANVNVPMAYLQRNMAVEIGKRDEVISISMRSPYPAEAAQIVNRVVDAYLASRSEHEQHNSAQVLRVLQDELLRTGKELDEKRNQLTEFQKDRMPLALGSDQGSGVTQQYLELQKAHTQAQIRRMEAESFRSAVQTLAQDPIGLRQYVQLRGSVGAYVSGDQEKAPLEARIIDLKHQKETLLKTVTAGWPSVVALTTEIAGLEAKLKELDDRFVKAVTAAAEQQYTEANKCEEQVGRLCGQQQEQVVTLNAEVAQYQRLRSEVDQLTTYSQTLEQQVREIRKIVGEDVGQLKMAVLEPALPAALPSEPQKARIMAMALIVGLLLGGGAAVTRDWLDQTLRSTDEISAVLRVPVLGAVPVMSRRKRMQERGRKVFLQPDSREAEAFRTIRTAVLFGAAPDGAKTLLITSPAAGDGKSTLVSNLAIALANAGQKTLILDADFRKPTQHVIFGLDPRERCLGDVFAGTMTLAAAVQPTGIEGLHVLTCGYRISNPAEVLNSPKFSHLLTCLTEVYDRILIDAPPVTVVTDAQILGALCDATVLVLRADKSLRPVALHAVDALQSVGARLLGVVVNEVRKSGSRYGYYYDRYHRYYHSHARRGGASQSKSRRPAVPLCVGAADPDARALPVQSASEGA